MWAPRQMLQCLPLVVALALAYFVYSKTKAGCGATIGKVPVVGGVCKTSVAKYAGYVLAACAGCLAYTFLKNMVGPQY